MWRGVVTLAEVAPIRLRLSLLRRCRSLQSIFTKIGPQHQGHGIEVQRLTATATISAVELFNISGEIAPGTMLDWRGWPMSGGADPATGVIGTFSYDGSGGVDLTIATIPEPGSAALLLARLALLALRGRLARR